MFAAFNTAICENYAMRRPTEFDNHSYLQEIAEILGSHKRATFWSHLYEKTILLIIVRTNYRYLMNIKLRRT